MRDDVRRTPKAIDEEKADASFQRIFTGIWRALVILVFVISRSKLTGTVRRTDGCGGIVPLCLKASTEHCCFEPERRARTEPLTCSIQTNT